MFVIWGQKRADALKNKQKKDHKLKFNNESLKKAHGVNCKIYDIKFYNYIPKNKIQIWLLK